MYTEKSINKVIHLMNDRQKFYNGVNVDQIKMCISTGNNKIGKVLNVSLPPVKTCCNCKECKYFCYDIKACLQYPGTVIDARIRNYMILIKDRNEYFNRIEKKISRRRKNKYFRWHVSGDILDLDYFERMVAIAANHQDFIFWTYTKNYKVINQYCGLYGKNSIPANFAIMFSEWDGLELINPYNFPIFTCKLKAGNKNHEPEFFETLYKCPGNCDICKAINRGCPAHESTYADEH